MKSFVEKLILIVLAVVFIGSVGYLIYYEINLKNTYSVTYQVIEDYDTESEEETKDWSSLQKENSDTVGWLKINNSSINTPIVQAKDNNYYLHKGFDKGYAFSGNPFVDYRNQIDGIGENTELNQNTIIYGHNMRDGKQFGELLSIYKNADTAKNHKYIYFDTVGGNHKWVVLGAFYTNANPSDNNGYCFPYNTPVMSVGEFSDFIEQLNQRYVFTSGVDVNNADKLLVLSTCSYNYKDERFVVVARLVRDNEENIEFNFEDKLLPRYPQKYYDKKNMRNPYKDYPCWSIS